MGLNCLKEIPMGGLYALLVFVHLAASGGQVYTSTVLSEGANSLVFALFFISGAAFAACTMAAVRDWDSFSKGPARARARGYAWGIIALGINNAIKSVAFIVALHYVHALNAAIYIPLIPVFAFMLTRFLGF